MLIKAMFFIFMKDQMFPFFVNIACDSFDVSRTPERSGRALLKMFSQQCPKCSLIKANIVYRSCSFLTRTTPVPHLITQTLHVM